MSIKWKIVFSRKAEKQIERLDRSAQKRILSYLHEKLETADDPRRFGKPLSDDLAGFWRYRVGDYRVIAECADDRLIITIIKAGHRKDVYE